MSLEKRLKEAEEFLQALGFDAQRSNLRSCRTLLALLKLNANTPWAKATNPALGIRGIADWIRDELAHDYAENSRESIRRFTVHQFLAAGLITMNEDDPARPRNSANTNYKITKEALVVAQSFGKPDFQQKVADYLLISPGLSTIYGAARVLARVPVTLPNGVAITLDAGGQNILIKQIIDDFCQLFAPGGEVIYIGDAEMKLPIESQSRLAELGVEVDAHGKLPDVIVYMEERNWLFLIEAASTHGPVDAHRYGELKQVFANSSADLVFVSCFPDRATMRGYLSERAWETEAWNAAEPTHLIHLNGSRFLGPY